MHLGATMSCSCGSISSWRWHFCGCWGSGPSGSDWTTCGSDAVGALLLFLRVLGWAVLGWVGRSLRGWTRRTVLLAQPVRRVRGIDLCSRLFCGICLLASLAAVRPVTPKMSSILISSYYISNQAKRITIEQGESYISVIKEGEGERVR